MRLRSHIYHVKIAKGCCTFRRCFLGSGRRKNKGRKYFQEDTLYVQFPELGHMNPLFLITDQKKWDFMIGLDQIMTHPLGLILSPYEKQTGAWVKTLLLGPRAFCLRPEKKKKKKSQDSVAKCKRFGALCWSDNGPCLLYLGYLFSYLCSQDIHSFILGVSLMNSI